jgi:hypothetical protein
MENDKPDTLHGRTISKMEKQHEKVRMKGIHLAERFFCYILIGNVNRASEEHHEGIERGTGIRKKKDS